MCTRLALYISVLFLAAPAMATGFKVNKISTSGGRAILSSGDGGVVAGDFVVFTDEFKEECFAKVMSSNDKEIIVDFNSCANAKEVKPGVEFQKVSQAQKPKIEKTSNPSLHSEETIDTPSKNESWYTLWGLGFSSIKYKKSFDRALDDLEAYPGFDRSSPLNMDLLGFYWPLNGHRAMQGFIIHAVIDTIKNEKTSESLTVSQAIYSYSYHHFFGENIGHGWFLRGDLGIARYSVSVEGPFYSYYGATQSGIGLLGGGGYAWPMSTETRFLLGGYLSHIDVKDFPTTSLNVTASFLF